MNIKLRSEEVELIRSSLEHYLNTCLDIKNNEDEINLFDKKQINHLNNKINKIQFLLTKIGR